MPRTLQRKKALDGNLTMTQYGYDIARIIEEPQGFSGIFIKFTLQTKAQWATEHDTGVRKGTLVNFVTKKFITSTMTETAQDDGSIIYEIAPGTPGGYPWALYMGLDGLTPVRYFQIPAGDVPVRESVADEPTGASDTIPKKRRGI